MSLRDEILSVDDLKREPIEIPEWPALAGKLFIRSMTGAERDAFESSLTNGDGKSRQLGNIRARLATLTLCDEAGQRIFDDKDAAALGKKSAAPLNRVFEASQRLNLLSNQDVEDLEKNSASGLNAASGSS